MAAKTYEVVSPRRYGTRMLQAGDTIELTQPQARIYSALGYVKPAPPKKAAKAPEPVIPTVEEVLSAEVVEDTPAPTTAPAAAKKAPAKRKAKAKK